MPARRLVPLQFRVPLEEVLQQFFPDSGIDLANDFAGLNYDLSSKEIVIQVRAYEVAPDLQIPRMVVEVPQPEEPAEPAQPAEPEVP